MSLDFTDIFCGAGGSSIGLVAAGLELKLAANHWDRAIATHAENFPAADHLVADVSNYDMRRLPRTQVLWASPECTWHSPAGGRKQASKIRAQLDLFDEYVPTDAGIRSRATAFDVIRAAEVHRYKVIIVENVVEFAAWEMFDWWLAGLRNLGYTCQLISVSSAHVGDASNAPAPQWRDRLYVYCTAEGVPVPDVSPRPIAWCPTCDQTVAAVQSWRHPNRRKVGKYRQQYDYRCPNSGCRYSVIEPYVLPAASIIDWTDLGARIGDRTQTPRGRDDAPHPGRDRPVRRADHAQRQPRRRRHRPRLPSHCRTVPVPHHQDRRRAGLPAADGARRRRLERHRHQRRQPAAHPDHPRHRGRLHPRAVHHDAAQPRRSDRYRRAAGDHGHRPPPRRHRPTRRVHPASTTAAWTTARSGT